MTWKGEQRRLFLRGACAAALPLSLMAMQLEGQGQGARTQRETGGIEGEDNTAPSLTGRKGVLEENEKDIKKKIAKLFQLASELKEEAEKTDSAKVLSVAMVRKAEEIERLAKDIKSRAKG
jgi:hypothetical protein